MSLLQQREEDIRTGIAAGMVDAFDVSPDTNPLKDHHSYSRKNIGHMPTPEQLLLQQLIRIPSVTPEDNGCQELIADRLRRLGFHCETMIFGDDLPTLDRNTIAAGGCGGRDDFADNNTGDGETKSSITTVSNLWAVYDPAPRDPLMTISPPESKLPLVVFLGHTDVVPPGPVEQWTYPPFDAMIVPAHEQNEENDIANKLQQQMGRESFGDDDYLLYGRGAVDMKGGIACFVSALEAMFGSEADQTGQPLSLQLPYRIGVLLTSDEEGEAMFGTRMVLQELKARGEQIDMCIVGEPSSLLKVGDVIKVGRRGSLSGDLTLMGIQGHVAYPHLAKNPIHESLGALKDLVDECWDEGTDDFQPTSFQISNIQSGTGALNVIPGFKKVHFNFRYSPASSDYELKQRVHQILDSHELEYDLKWSETSFPYETASGELLEETMLAIQDVVTTDNTSSVSSKTTFSRPCTSGGTSDGRFVARAFEKAQILELGLINKTIHQIDEHTSIRDLNLLTSIYKRILERIRDAEIQNSRWRERNIDKKTKPQQKYHSHVDIDALP